MKKKHELHRKNVNQFEKERTAVEKLVTVAHDKNSPFVKLKLAPKIIYHLAKYYRYKSTLTQQVRAFQMLGKKSNCSLLTVVPNSPSTEQTSH